jgi:hypothetical protein
MGDENRDKRKLEMSTFEEWRTLHLAKFDRLEEKVKDTIKKYDPTFDKIHSDIRGLEQKITKTDQRIVRKSVLS